MALTPYIQKVRQVTGFADQVRPFRDSDIRGHDLLRGHHNSGGLPDHRNTHRSSGRPYSGDRSIGCHRVRPGWQPVPVDAVGVGADADVRYPVGGWGQRIVDDAAAVDRFAGCQSHGSAHQPPAVPESAPEREIGCTFCRAIACHHRNLTPCRSRLRLQATVRWPSRTAGAWALCLTCRVAQPDAEMVTWTF